MTTADNAAHRYDSKDSNIKQNWLGRHRKVFTIVVPVLFIIICAVLYITGGRYISTDDAYVSAARVSISPSIAGRVIDVEVADNQWVHKGDVLFKLDDRPFVITMHEAEAQLASAYKSIRPRRTIIRDQPVHMLHKIYWPINNANMTVRKNSLLREFHHMHNSTKRYTNFKLLNNKFQHPSKMQIQFLPNLAAM
jgi:multidrug resistance efflux pump